MITMIVIIINIIIINIIIIIIIIIREYSSTLYVGMVHTFQLQVMH